MEAYREGQGGDGEALAMHLADRQRTGVEQIETAMELVAADLRATEIIEVTDEGRQLKVCIGSEVGGQPIEDRGRAVGFWGVGGAHCQGFLVTSLLL